MKFQVNDFVRRADYPSGIGQVVRAGETISRVRWTTENGYARAEFNWRLVAVPRESVIPRCAECGTGRDEIAAMRTTGLDGGVAGFLQHEDAICCEVCDSQVS